MTIEQKGDDFPVGMRVLAVDDDPICLRLLETLLRKCQYHVTTANQAIIALEMLRENKNNFDLVISDVHMPDMDGFKLLELVGLEMDLPVIMLSANGDTKLVMKGITHGACDYLVKPVRMEELKNIWQHVLRRKKSDTGDRSSNSQGKNSNDRNELGNGNSDLDAKFSKKRKDQIVDDDDDDDDDEQDEDENDDPSSQKRPRVVWSVELHRKFVAAVNQLGLDKAVPKKILELMNVDKLTRENVASHLQKYRLYLKRISSVANQQANMVAALGGPDAAYLRMTSVNFHGFNASPQFPSNGLRSIPPSGVLGRLNTPTGLGLHGLSPSNMVQLGNGQIPRQPSFLPGDQTGPVLQGRPTSLEFDQLQHRKGITGVDELCPTNDNSRVFPVSGSSNSLLGLPNSSFTMQARSHERQNHETFGINSDLPPNLLGHNRSSNNSLHDIPVNISGQTRLHDSRIDAQSQAGLMGDNMVHNMGYAPKQVWDDHRMDILNHSDFLDNPGNSSMTLHRNAGFGAMTQPRIDTISSNQMFDNSGLGTAMKLKQGQFIDQGRSLGTYPNNGAGSLEDVVTAMFKQEQDNVKGWRFGM